MLPVGVESIGREVLLNVLPEGWVECYGERRHCILLFRLGSFPIGTVDLQYKDF